jgi:SAM-dependent methyltransferase
MWSAVAPSWAEFAQYTDERSARETSAMLAAVIPKHGERVLELACGAGGLGLAAARAVGPDGDVVLSDVSPEMVAIAARRAAKQSVRVATRVLDLESIAESDASFDIVLCRHGLQFTIDSAAALAEIHRVLRPGGRVALTVWGPPAQNPWLAAVMEAVSTQLGRPVPPPGMPGPFSLANVDEIATRVVASGLTGLSITKIAVPLEADDAETWWKHTSGLAGPVSTILKGLDQETASAIRERAATSLAPYRVGAAYHVPGMALMIIARRGEK